MFGCKMFANQSSCRCFVEAGTSAPVTVTADTSTEVVVSIFAGKTA